MTTVSNLFSVRYGHSLELNRLRLSDSENGIAFVSRKMGDNGVSAFVAPIPGLKPASAGELSVALGGNGVLSTFLQEREFYTGRDVAILHPKKRMSKSALLYYCMCIKANRYRYSYGRQANRSLGSLQVPSVARLPKWVSSVDVGMFEGADAILSDHPIPLKGQSNWRIFKFSDLFDIHKGKRLTKAKMTPGTTPYIGAIDGNNGVSAFVGQKPRHPANTITVNYNGSVGEAYYQPAAFWATDDANVLYPRFDLTPAAAMFVITVIRLERYRFNYGRKWNKERMEESTIRLPAKPSGDLDLDYMTRFICSLKFSASIGQMMP